MTPRKKRVLKNKTLAELGLVRASYPIKLRLKEFVVQHKDGTVHKRGPCLSIQQFNPEGHFLSAISIDLKDLEALNNKLISIEVLYGDKD